MNDFAMSGASGDVPTISAPNSLGINDLALSGGDLSWGAVDYVATKMVFMAMPLNWHRHPGQELLFLLKGASGYHFDQGQKTELTGGHFMLIPARMAHRGARHVREPSTLCAVILSDEDAAWSGGIFTPDEAAWIRRSLGTETPQIRPMTAAMRHAARWLRENLVNLDRAKSRDRELLVGIRLQVSFLILQAALQMSQPPKASPTLLIERAKAYLTSHHAEPFTMSHLTEHTRCSRTRLFQAFKQETGMTPVDWLQRFRVGKAVELLQTTDRTLEDIAAAVGLTSGPYLCHTVKRYTGRTPGGHRRTTVPG
jgi:AraC-like DNA-binding protein